MEGEIEVGGAGMVEVWSSLDGLFYYRYLMLNR
jgi:hypothetical protein